MMRPQRRSFICGAKARVSAHSIATVTVEVDPRAMHTWSVADHEWARAADPYELRVGTSSRDIAVTLPVD